MRKEGRFPGWQTLVLVVAISLLLGAGLGVSRAGEKELPLLLMLGAPGCPACRRMVPVLEELAREYEGRLKVAVIDVWEHPETGREFGIRLIPTQIFFSPAREELARQVGYLSKEEILKKWQELGYTFDDK